MGRARFRPPSGPEVTAPADGKRGCPEAHARGLRIGATGASGEGRWYTPAPEVPAIPRSSSPSPAGDAGQASRREWILPGLAAGLAFLGALRLFPLDCDGSHALHDPIWAGTLAERDPRGSLLAHHLLYHVLAALLAPALDALGCTMPGFLATRVLSGLASAAILLLLAGLSGPGRRHVGLALGLLLFSMRGFFLEGMLGENVLLGAVSATIALQAAVQGVALPRLGALLGLALLFRQDNLFLVPSVLFAAARARPRGRRLGPLALFLVATGLGTLGLYALAWCVHPSRDFVAWMLHLPMEAHRLGAGFAPGLEGFSLAGLLRHAAALGKAVVGRQWDHGESEAHAWAGGAALLLFVLAGLLARGRGRTGPFALAAGLAVLLRAIFYIVFEPDNFEWWLLPLLLAAAALARLSAGSPMHPAPVRRIAFVLGLALACVLLRAHLPESLRLRDRRIAEAADAAVAAGGRDARYFAYLGGPLIALYARGQPVAAHLPADLDQAAAAVQAALDADPRATVLILDLGVQGGSPADLRELSRRYPEGRAPDFPGMRVIHLRGHVSALGFHLP
jgi:hypothetical protein